MFDEDNKFEGNEVENENVTGNENTTNSEIFSDEDFSAGSEDFLNNENETSGDNVSDIENKFDSGSKSEYEDFNSVSNDSQNGGGQKKKKNGKIPLIIVACVLIIALFGAGIYGLTKKIDSIIQNSFASYENDTSTSDDTTEYPSIGTTVSENSSDESSSAGVTITDVSDVVDAVMPSIVAITSTTYVNDAYSYYNWMFGNSDSNTYVQTGAGSGIIIGENDSELLIVTNNHVVEDTDSLSIQFVDDTSVEGYVKGTDPSSDLAVVSIPLSDISADTLSTIKIATLGDSDELQVGDGVIAIGNALGYGQSVTTGVISALEREITVDDVTMTVLQTDAAINAGNSGGALLNSKGEVIGINCAKYSSSTYSGSAIVEGMGFAIPISSAVDIINDLMNRETRTIVDEDKQGSLGIKGYSVSSEESEYYSIPVGILVTDVISGGAAEKAGIEATDVITKFDGQTVTTMEELKNLLQYYEAGETVAVTISYRDGRIYSEKEVNVTLSGTDILSDQQ